MTSIVWNDDLATGIGVIDSQHKRIIDYINQLADARLLDDSKLVGEVLINLIDYTMSHFAFEESLMEEAGYHGAGIHSRTHDSFRGKINDYHSRYRAGEDVAEDLMNLLNIWLIEHIASDDSSYAPCVLKNMSGINTGENDGWISGKIKAFFS